MKTVNKVILIGNVTKDAFIKNIGPDRKVALFTVATNRTYKNARGEAMSEAEYTNCSAWGPLADHCQKFLTKSKLVYIEGYLKTHAVEREDGQKIFKTEVVVLNLIFLSRREDEMDGGNGGSERGSAPVAPGDDFADIDMHF